MLVNLVFSVEPIVLTIAMMATEMPAAIRPYSIAVAPELVLEKRNNLGHVTRSRRMSVATIGAGR